MSVLNQILQNLIETDTFVRLQIIRIQYLDNLFFINLK